MNAAHTTSDNAFMEVKGTDSHAQETNPALLSGAVVRIVLIAGCEIELVTVGNRVWVAGEEVEPITQTLKDFPS